MLKKFNQYIKEAVDSEQVELDKIQRWLKETTEFYDDWDWDGELLTIFDGDEAIEKYTREELEEEKVI